MSLVALIPFVVAVVLVASTRAVFKLGAWYEGLAKPSWTPPDWAFPVVWSILYLSIAIAGWLVWQEVGWSLVIVVWCLQLLLNGAWSWLFFGLRRMDLALTDIALLWLCIAAFIILAWPTSSTAALLFLPYLVWVSIAAALNLTVWRMNPAAA